MDDLVRWLGEQLDEDERIARGATDGPWTRWRGGRLHGLADLIHPVLTPGQKPGAKAVIVTASWLDADHIAEWDPSRVLREIDAKRRTLVRCQEAMLAASPMLVHFAKQTVREMALGFSHRPGYEKAVAAFA